MFFEKEINYLVNHLLPNMHKLFALTNPTEYHRYNGNAYRQTAFLTAMHFEHEMETRNDLLQIQNVVVFEDVMDLCVWDEDEAFYVAEKTFRHAFVSLDLMNSYLIVDLSQTRHFDPYIRLSNFPSLYEKYFLSDKPRMYIKQNGFLPAKNISSTVCHNVCLSRPEFYTRLRLEEIYEFCKKASSVERKPNDESGCNVGSVPAVRKD